METIERNNGMDLSADRSLQIIGEAIERSRKAMTKNAGNSYIAWGTVVAVTALVISYLWMNHGGPIWNWLWATIFITGPILHRLLKIDDMEETASHLGRLIGKVWFSMGLFSAIIGFGTGLFCGLLHIELSTDLTATIILLYGIAATITGFMLKNRLIIATGLIGGLGGYFGAIAVSHSAYGLLVLAAVSVISGVIPGILIKLNNRK